MSLLIEYPLTYDRTVCHYYSPKLDTTTQVCHQLNKLESITLTVRERVKDTVFMHQHMFNYLQRILHQNKARVHYTSH